MIKKKSPASKILALSEAASAGEIDFTALGNTPINVKLSNGLGLFFQRTFLHCQNHRKPLVITILFDIDGTLIRTGGAGMVAIGQTMKEMFQLDEISKVAVHGRTDEGILTDLFAAHSLKFDQHRDAFSRRYWELLPEALAAGEGHVLPGVEALLTQLEAMPEVALGILTGNAQRAAAIKLEHFGLQDFFGFGGYGDRHSDRNDVAKMARQAAAESLAQQFQTDQVWVVGDTVNDVTCARAIDAKVIAVETGGGDPSVLKESSPDCQLATLTQAEEFLQAINS